MASFLRTKNIDVDGEQVTITQLSGLERFDFIDYCSDLPKPEFLSDETSADEEGVNSSAIEEAFMQWQRTNFIAQSRLVAYGYKDAAGDVETRHKTVMSTMTVEQVKRLHDEIALLSGIPLPKSAEETDDVSEESETEREPSGPKS